MPLIRKGVLVGFWKLWLEIPGLEDFRIPEFIKIRLSELKRDLLAIRHHSYAYDSGPLLNRLITPAVTCISQDGKKYFILRSKIIDHASILSSQLEISGRFSNGRSRPIIRQLKQLNLPRKCIKPFQGILPELEHALFQLGEFLFKKFKNFIIKRTGPKVTYSTRTIRRSFALSNETIQNSYSPYVWKWRSVKICAKVLWYHSLLTSPIHHHRRRLS